MSTFNISSLLYLNLKYVHLIRSFQKNIPAYGRPQNISICEDSSIGISRIVCQDRHLSLGGIAYLPGLAKPPYLLNQYIYIHIYIYKYINIYIYIYILNVILSIFSGDCVIQLSSLRDCLIKLTSVGDCVIQLISLGDCVIH